MTDLPVLTTSERSSFRRCPWQWYLRFRLGLSPLGETADARWFGIGVHIALAEWYQKGYKRGPHPADIFADWCGEEIRYVRASMAEKDREWFDEPKYEDARELGVAMLENYVDYYGKDRDWYIIAIETPFSVEIKRQGQPVAIFKSTWDGVFRDKRDGRVYLLENKTASQINTAYLELDDQGGSYWAVASAILRSRGILNPGETIAGIMYNFLRKSRPDPRPQNAEGAYLNQDGKVSKKQPPAPFLRTVVERLPGELRSQMDRMADEVQIMNGMRAGTIPITKSTSKDCTFCDFFDLCVLHEKGTNDWRELARASYTQSDPYARYTQKSASGSG
jgi:hypothetical protein